ncbi:MAG: hypothetical protein DRH26_14640, partial [Deltaproteobacteria bacterium]
MESLKPSVYNYKVVLSDGNTLWFNFFTLSLMVLDSMDASLAQDILNLPNKSWSGGRPVQIKKSFKNNGFLINTPVSEIDYIKQEYFQQRRIPKNLNLTILPSLACNFRCIYCYEKHETQSMSPEVEAALLKMITNRLPEKGRLFVTWFGGEPLLQIDTIERLSSAFNKICAEKNGKYSAQIITNGFLFNRKNAERLHKNNVNKAQITLDGPKHIHDKRRPGTNGGKTFDKIISNLRESSKIIPVSLRINIDETNRKYIPELLDLLSSDGLAKN